MLTRLQTTIATPTNCFWIHNARVNIVAPRPAWATNICMEGRAERLCIARGVHHSGRSALHEVLVERCPQYAVNQKACQTSVQDTMSATPRRYQTLRHER